MHNVENISESFRQVGRAQKAEKRLANGQQFSILSKKREQSPRDVPGEAGACPEHQDKGKNSFDTGPALHVYSCKETCLSPSTCQFHTKNLAEAHCEG